MTPGFNARTYIHRVDQRCQTELDWPWRDAGILYPEAFDRIVEDEWDHEMRRTGIHP